MKALIVSLGCNKNLVDSEVMAGYLKNENILLTNDAEKADVIIVNTCGFIEDAKVEAIDTIFEMVQFKQKNCKALIVSGCLAQRYADAIFDMPEVDGVIGTYYYENIVSVINSVLEGKRVKNITGTPEYLDRAPREVSTKYYAYLKIAEGCDNKCAYCAIPAIRGKYVSRKIDSLLNEAKALKAQGIKEIILTAQDTTRFGSDNGEYQLAHLLEEIAKLGFDWVRVMYAYPSSFSQEIISVMEKYDNICKYIDIPIQHTEDKMLALMNRHYSKADVEDIMQRLKNSACDWCVRTTLMCGFPGETDKEHKAMLKFIQKYPFDNLGVFVFSCEEGTEAEKMSPKCRRSTSLNRCDAVMLMQAQIVAKNAKRREGQVYKTLAEGFDSEQKLWFGRGEFLAPEVDGKIFFSGENVTLGEFYQVKIDEAVGYDFYGRIV